jgi:hypothetical protein
MYPLVYHLGVDDYFPNEDFEPHLFEHVAARRAAQRPSLMRRLGTAALAAIGLRRGPSHAEASPCGSARAPEPAIRWG